jgi:large subunit ribosomal protein L23
MSKKAENRVLLKHYDVLAAPHVTEKATALTAYNQYVFLIAPEVTKKDVKASVESLYKVKVLSVNTVQIAGKSKTFRGRRGKKNDIRKAVVRISEGQSIDMSVGV